MCKYIILCFNHVYVHTHVCVCVCVCVWFSTYCLYIYDYREESAKIVGVGVDQLLKDGKLESLKDGPVYWVDSADSQPCMGTASAVMWTLKCRGRLFHSGLPHKVWYY